METQRSPPPPCLEAHKVTPHDLLQETPTVLEMISTLKEELDKKIQDIQELQWGPAYGQTKFKGSRREDETENVVWNLLVPPKDLLRQ